MGCSPWIWIGPRSWRPRDGCSPLPQSDGQETGAPVAPPASRLPLSQEGLSAYRELLEVGTAPLVKRLPELLTDAELVAFYEAIWQARQLTHGVMLKLLLFTGIRNTE